MCWVDSVQGVSGEKRHPKTLFDGGTHPNVELTRGTTGTLLVEERCRRKKSMGGVGEQFHEKGNGKKTASLPGYAVDERTTTKKKQKLTGTQKYTQSSKSNG